MPGRGPGLLISPSISRAKSIIWLSVHLEFRAGIEFLLTRHQTSGKQAPRHLGRVVGLNKKCCISAAHNGYEVIFRRIRLEKEQIDANKTE